jgi:hypothetical protein
MTPYRSVAWQIGLLIILFIRPLTSSDGEMMPTESTKRLASRARLSLVPKSPREAGSESSGAFAAEQILRYVGVGVFGMMTLVGPVNPRVPQRPIAKDE